MNLEHKVASLEWSKKLKACGFPQKTLFYRFTSGGDITALMMRIDDNTYRSVGKEYEEFPSIKEMEIESWSAYASPLPCEIAGELPRKVCYKGKEYHLEIWRVDMGDADENNEKLEYAVGYIDQPTIKYDETGLSFQYLNIEIYPILANAMSAMYCYLVEKGLIQVQNLHTKETG